MAKKIFTPLTADQVAAEFNAYQFKGYTLTDWVKIDGKNHHVAIVEAEGKIKTYVNGQLQNESEVG